MRGLITIALLLIAGQATAGEQLISVQHDSIRSVTCWITPQGGISCLPDSLLRAPTSTTTDESQAARASLANTEGEKGQFTTTPLPPEKGFQL